MSTPYRITIIDDLTPKASLYSRYNGHPEDVLAEFQNLIEDACVRMRRKSHERTSAALVKLVVADAVDAGLVPYQNDDVQFEYTVSINARNSTNSEHAIISESFTGASTHIYLDFGKPSLEKDGS